MDPSHSIVVTDTSLLINFLVIDRVSLLSGCGYQIYITDHVISEVTAHYPEQIARLKKALAANQLQQIIITDQAEILLFQNLTKTRRLGVGEPSVRHQLCKELGFNNWAAVRKCKERADKRLREALLKQAKVA